MTSITAYCVCADPAEDDVCFGAEAGHRGWPSSVGIEMRECCSATSMSNESKFSESWVTDCQKAGKLSREPGQLHQGLKVGPKHCAQNERE